MGGEEGPGRPAPRHCERGPRARGSWADNARADPVTHSVLAGRGLGRRSVPRALWSLRGVAHWELGRKLGGMKITANVSGVHMSYLTLVFWFAHQ